MLDNSVVLWAKEMGDASEHVCTDVPFVLAGGGGGYFNTGQYLSFDGEPHNKLRPTVIDTLPRWSVTHVAARGSGSGSVEIPWTQNHAPAMTALYEITFKVRCEARVRTLLGSEPCVVVLAQAGGIHSIAVAGSASAERPGGAVLDGAVYAWGHSE